MYSVTKTFKISSAHKLSHLPKDHKCNNIHGHNYNIEVTIITQTLNKDGFVIDFSYLKAICDRIINKYDHVLILNNNDPINDNSTLGKIIKFDFYDLPFTCEVFARKLHTEIVDELINIKIINSEFNVKIKIYESDTSYVTYIE